MPLNTASGGFYMYAQATLVLTQSGRDEGGALFPDIHGDQGATQVKPYTGA